jgi:hypothetical protein
MNLAGFFLLLLKNILLENSIFVSQSSCKGFFSSLFYRKNYLPEIKNSATIKIINIFQSQMRKKCSEARVKFHGDIPFAAAWWSWLMR